MKSLRYLSGEEWQAIERAARRARREELARLAGVAAAGIKSLLSRAVSALRAKGPRHA